MPTRLEDDAQCLLLIIGPTPEGKKELVGLTYGVRESAQSWRKVLLDLKRHGLAIAPELVVADGALGLWKAIGEVWPKTRGQCCARCTLPPTCSTGYQRASCLRPNARSKISGWHRPTLTPRRPSMPSSRLTA